MNSTSEKIKILFSDPYRAINSMVLKLAPMIKDDELYLKLRYYFRFHRLLNLDNPQTFNEKLQWLKLHDRKPEYSQMVDKYEAKKYVAGIIGEEYIIPTLGIWERAEDIDFDSLPAQFVLKCTHDSGGIIICKDKSKLDLQAAKAKLAKYLKRQYFTQNREWAYKNVKPRIIAEQYMEDESGSDLMDYKIFCFDGKAKIIQVDYDRFTNHTRNLYSTNWEYIEATICYPTNPEHQIPKPEKLDEMLALAEKLSKGIPHLRIDFYYINNKIYFGELTFYHGSGMERFVPEEFGKTMGEYLKLPMVEISQR